jgi:RNA polymerase sigma factor for flagellar operon FliA
MPSTAAPARRLSAQEAEDLWRAFMDRNDHAARDRLVLAYSPMVRHLAARKTRELPAHWDVEDLVSCGLIALMEAILRFDPSRGASFEQYAWTRVSGAFGDELRRQDWCTRASRQLGRRADQVRDRWHAKTGTAPSDGELAGALHVEVRELRARMEELARADVRSLNAPAREPVDGELEMGGAVPAVPGADDPELALLARERAGLLREALAELSPRERQVLALVHVRELPGAEIGRMLGVTESRVSQILNGGRRKLRARMAAEAA